MLKPIKARAQGTIVITLTGKRSKWRHLYCLRCQVWLLPKSEGNQEVSIIFFKWNNQLFMANQPQLFILREGLRIWFHFAWGKIYYSLSAQHKFSQIPKSKFWFFSHKLRKVYFVIFFFSSAQLNGQPRSRYDVITNISRVIEFWLWGILRINIFGQEFIIPYLLTKNFHKFN